MINKKFIQKLQTDYKENNSERAAKNNGPTRIKYFLPVFFMKFNEVVL